jgi:protein-disulfide isomerase
MKVALALLLAAALACRPSDGGSQNAPSPPAGATTRADAQNERENDILARADSARIKGDSAAPIWMVEVSDFQCPFCRRFWQETYPDIEREFIKTGIVRLAYVNMPLQMHANAAPAAEAAMCAAEQGRFWPIHDALFATQERWAELDNPAPVFDSLARAAGVDEPRYQGCLQSNVMRRLINADLARATSAGIRGTPYFFVGSERIEGAAPIGEFRAAVARALAARQRPGTGSSP